MPLTCDDGSEAKEWLTSQAARHGFAPKRFGIKDEAIAFVEDLYNAGAAEVFIPSDDISAQVLKSRDWKAAQPRVKQVMLSPNRKA